MYSVHLVGVSEAQMRNKEMELREKDTQMDCINKHDAAEALWGSVQLQKVWDSFRSVFMREWENAVFTPGSFGANTKAFSPWHSCAIHDSTPSQSQEAHLQELSGATLREVQQDHSGLDTVCHQA